ncbi:MAG: twin-arginine translocase TatA/TatE family subunit [Mariprofundales bacterium]
MFGLGTTELLLILLLVIIFFGAGKLPELGAGVARGIKSFKKNLHDEDKPQIPEDKS